jgi:NodT family efflux transporter outer membrane factor (OMF) lipoprotein
MTGLKIAAALTIATGAAAFAISGCVVGPGYKAPAPPTPSTGAFSATLPPTVGIAMEPPPNWWELYKVPALDALVQDALVHNTNIEVAAANLATARGALSQARAGRYPSTNLSSSATYGVSTTSAADAVAAGLPPPHASPYYVAGLDASYEIDFFGRITQQIRAARADVEAQQAAEDIERVSVAGETTRAYLDACAYAEELAVAKRSLDLINQTYNLTVVQARYGVASEFDLARERQLVAQTQATLPGYEGQRRTALFELAVLTGRPPEEISRDADACKAPPKLTTLLPIGDVRGLFKRRPDVRQAERQLARDYARIGVATADLFPTVNISAFGQTAAGSLGSLGTLGALSYGIGPTLSWSFPNILVARAEIRQARGNASASYARFQGSVLQALQDTEEAVTNYGAELDRHASLITSRDQARIAARLAEVQYQNGAASFLDIITAQTNLVEAEQSLAGSDQAIVSDQVTLFKALGGGWEQAPEARAPGLRDAKTGKTIEVR